VTPARRIAGFLARYTPAIRREAQKARRALRRRMPTAVEMVYDNYNALVFGFGPTERPSEAILSLALYPRWVTLFLLQGARLPDPDKLLRGSGSTVRSIRLESAEDLARPAIRALIDRALRQAEIPLPESGRGVTVIRSVSEKQRSRRPA
jgi:hypothetical protein